MTARNSAQAAPVFVYGALRSGTTVFRLMLNAHPGISNPGEADFLFDILAPDGQGGWHYDLDELAMYIETRNLPLTLPGGMNGLALLGDLIAQLERLSPGVLTLNVHRHAKRIIEVLPEARFIHLLRDPRDVARSCIGMGWAGTTYHGVISWIHTEAEWDRAEVDSEQVIELRYEDLFADIETELKRICVFLDVPFDPAMLQYHENTSYGPPDPSLVKQWQRKIPAPELALLEGRLGPMLTERGYGPSGTPPRQPGALERLWLLAQNKIGVWRFGIGRYGPRLFLMEKISRWLGLAASNRRIRAELRRRSEPYLK